MSDNTIECITLDNGLKALVVDEEGARAIALLFGCMSSNTLKEILEDNFPQAFEYFIRPASQFDNMYRLYATLRYGE